MLGNNDGFKNDQMELKFLSEVDVKNADEKMHRAVARFAKAQRVMFWTHDGQSLAGKNFALVETLLQAFDSTKSISANNPEPQAKTESLIGSLRTQIHSVYLNIESKVGKMNFIYFRKDRFVFNEDG